MKEVENVKLEGGGSNRLGSTTSEKQASNDTILKEIIFRARRVDNGEWAYGSYVHTLRKVTMHSIIDKCTNICHEVYRESLQIRNRYYEFENI